MNTRLPDFDILLDMARNDPEGLETLRRSLTGAVIASAISDNTARTNLVGDSNTVPANLTAHWANALVLYACALYWRA
jgi:hypothetical protein